MAEPDGARIVMRVHRVRTEFVVAACDEALLERELPIGTRGRTVRVSRAFYGERCVGREELLWALERATIANLLGPEVCRVAVEAGLIAAGTTGQLGGVPHAEIVAMPSA